MKKALHFIEKLFGVYRWHPILALRYLPIVEALVALDEENKSILEVGSGGLGIVPYLKRPVVGLDITFDPPIYPLLIPVKGSALAIPFATGSFDTVISTDMLEHLSMTDRKKAISEIMRVAKRYICIGVPCGKAAQALDAQLAELYKSARDKQFNFFAEHAHFGLPEASNIKKLIEDAASTQNKNIQILEKATFNLTLRKFLMRGWISQNKLVDFIFRKGFLLFVPLFRMGNQSPTYRHLFFVTITS